MNVVKVVVLIYHVVDHTRIMIDAYDNYAKHPMHLLYLSMAILLDG
jgi:hypothetical protein